MRRSLCGVLAAVIILAGAHIIVREERTCSAAAGPAVMRSRFVTSFASSGEARRANIALAAKAIDRVTVQPGETASFNGMTGERTPERGYREAKIILDGVYVSGVGGGVCQVSTTLYNALLLADVEVTEVHRHTIRSSYVAPSFDAMVDYGYSDLKFVNSTRSPLILRAAARGDDLVVEVHGEPMDCTIRRVSEIIGVVAPPPPQVIPDTEGKYQNKVIYIGERYVIRNAAEGCYSKGYLVKTRAGESVKTLIRTDYYSPVQRVEVEGTLQPS